jgi:tRNA (guanine37-N1)-methyltransferase
LKSSNKRSTVDFRFLTLFPEVFPPVLSSSLLGKAEQRGLVSYGLTQIRDFATDKHRSVDGTPYGGGEGMVLRPDVLYDAWRSVVPRKTAGTVTILMTPQGEPFTQQIAKELASCRKIVLICGHYEGIDERFVDLCVDRELSIGDYVLTGGELPAMVVADTVTRLLPGVVGNERSLTEETFEKGLLKYPQYTRPREFKGLEVPEVLLGGNHKAIASWRRAQMEDRTKARRPDLLKKS